MCNACMLRMGRKRHSKWLACCAIGLTAEYIASDSFALSTVLNLFVPLILHSPSFLVGVEI